MKVLWSPVALERMGEIADRIAEDAPGAVEAWLDGIFRAVERLARFPQIRRAAARLTRRRGRRSLGARTLSHAEVH